jgi:predicted enzyme related to lactoylglutathione lyase
MEKRHKVVGLGGVFFKARDPKALAQWYATHLGVPVFPDATFAAFKPGSGPDARPPGTSVWATFATDSEYFGAPLQQSMVNYRVADLDGMLAQLREEGVKVDAHIEDSEFGRFGWGHDPEGNRFELWQPPQASS